jgi:hypothetical protein
LLLTACSHDAASGTSSGSQFVGWWFPDDPELDYGPQRMVESHAAYVFTNSDGSVGNNPRFTLRGDQLVMEGEDERNYDHLSLSPDGRQMYVEYCINGVVDKTTWRRGSEGEIRGAETVENLQAVETALKSWRDRYAGYPAVDDVQQSGDLSDFLKPWPTNPFTSAPMSVGTSPGDFQYTVSDDWRSHTLRCYLTDGSTYRIPDK